MPAMLIFLFFLALFSFLFSASETAIIALSKIRLHHMLKQGIRRAESIQRLTIKLDKFIAVILIGNNFVNIAISAMVTGVFVYYLGQRWGILAATFLTTVFVLIFCEVTPKMLATKHTEKIALFTAPIMEVITAIFDPLAHFFTSISNFILKILGFKPSKRSPLITEEELRMMIEIGKEEGVLSDEERKMLHKIFEFGDTKVGEVMVPKEKMIAVNLDSNPDQLLNIFVEEGHARLPVYKDSPDNIIGIIYARDLLYILRDKGLFVLSDLVHAPYCVPYHLKVNELLKKFQSDKLQIAIVSDEHKKTLGMVTLEDLVEEIVGEIEEKHVKHVSLNNN